MTPAAYDKMGVGYATRRRPDPRIAARIRAALGEARRVLNVGAGTGSYEPDDRDVVALEPSSEMIAQRPDTAAPVIQGTADALPFDDDSFDAAMAVLTIHHWPDPAAGLREMRRITTGPLVILTFDPAIKSAWLLDYFPEIAAQDDGRMPPMTLYADVLGQVDIQPVPIPHDCTDGFLYAYWQRPDAYLDPTIRTAMSSFHLMSDPEPGLARLADDLASGAWEARYGHLREKTELDLGYRLVIA